MAVDEKWYFTKEQLLQSPSRKSGYDVDKELSCRQQAANFIQDMGQRLQVSQLCINTAIVYMHRFYVFHSLAAFHRNAIAAAALFLAAKVEEQPRKLEHVIKVAHMCLHRENPNLDTKSELYLEQAQDLVFNENVLLQTLGFDVAIDHPHTHVVRCCHLVRASKDLAQTSYFMASNSLHLTTMCLQYKPTVVACFCIHLACKWSNWEIPRSNEGKDWFWYIDKTVTVDLLEQLTAEFLAILDKCPTKLKRKMMSMNQNNTPGFTQQSIPNDTLHFEEPRKLTGSEANKPPEGLFPVQKANSQSSAENKPGATVPTSTSSSSAQSGHAHHQKIDYREYREKKERERMEREKQQQQQQQQQHQRDGHNMSSSNHHHHHSKSNMMPGKSHSAVQSRGSSTSVSHKSYQQPPHGMQQNVYYQNAKDVRESSSQGFQSSSSKDGSYLKQHPPHAEREGSKDGGPYHGQYPQNSGNMQHPGYPHKPEGNYSGNYSHREGNRGGHSAQSGGNSNLSQSHHGQNQNSVANNANLINNSRESVVGSQRESAIVKDADFQAKDSTWSSIRDIISQSVSQKDMHSISNDRKEHVRDKSRVNYVHGNSTASNFRPDSIKPARSDRPHDKHRKPQELEQRVPNPIEGASAANDTSKHHKLNKEAAEKHNILLPAQHSDQKPKEKLSPSKYQKPRTVQQRPPSLGFVKSEPSHFTLEKYANNVIEEEKLETPTQLLYVAPDEPGKSVPSLNSFQKQKTNEFGAPGNQSSSLPDASFVKSNKTSSIFSPDSKIPPQNILNSLEKDSKKMVSSAHRGHAADKGSEPGKKATAQPALPAVTTSTTSSTGSLFSPPLPKSGAFASCRHRTSSSGSEPEQFPNEIRSDLGAVIYPSNPKPTPVSKPGQGFGLTESKLCLANSVSTVNLLGIEKMVDTSISPAKQSGQFGDSAVKGSVPPYSSSLPGAGASAPEQNDKTMGEQKSGALVSNQDSVDVDVLGYAEKKRSEKKKKKEKHKHKDKDKSERKKEKKKHKDKDKEKSKEKDKHREKDKHKDKQREKEIDVVNSETPIKITIPKDKISGSLKIKISKDCLKKEDIEPPKANTSGELKIKISKDVFSTINTYKEETKGESRKRERSPKSAGDLPHSKSIKTSDKKSFTTSLKSNGMEGSSRNSNSHKYSVSETDSCFDISTLYDCPFDFEENGQGIIKTPDYDFEALTASEYPPESNTSPDANDKNSHNESGSTTGVDCGAEKDAGTELGHSSPADPIPESLSPDPDPDAAHPSPVADIKGEDDDSTKDRMISLENCDVLKNYKTILDSHSRRCGSETLARSISPVSPEETKPELNNNNNDDNDNNNNRQPTDDSATSPDKAPQKPLKTASDLDNPNYYNKYFKKDACPRIRSREDKWPPKDKTRFDDRQRYYDGRRYRPDYSDRDRRDDRRFYRDYREYANPASPYYYDRKDDRRFEYPDYPAGQYFTAPTKPDTKLPALSYDINGNGASTVYQGCAQPKSAPQFPQICDSALPASSSDITVSYQYGYFNNYMYPPNGGYRFYGNVPFVNVSLIQQQPIPPGTGDAVVPVADPPPLPLDPPPDLPPPPETPPPPPK